MPDTFSAVMLLGSRQLHGPKDT